MKGGEIMYVKQTNKKPRTRKAMIKYLAGHGRYHTMNSWNNSTSYACCVKVDRLGLDHELVMTALEMLEVHEAFDDFRDALLEFDERHNHCWQIGTNGRSGGYLVLYQGGIGSDGRIFTWPGKSLDMHADYSEWETEELKRRVDIVWDFDTACEDAVASFVDFARTHTVTEEEILVPRRIKVAVPKA